MDVKKSLIRQFWIHIYILSLSMIACNAAPHNKSEKQATIILHPRNSTEKGITPSSILHNMATPPPAKLDSPDTSLKFPTRRESTTKQITSTTSGFKHRRISGPSQDQRCKDKIGGILCNNIDNYPAEDIARMFKSPSIIGKFKQFFINDSIAVDKVETKIDDIFDTSQPICATRENTYIPKGAFDKYSQLKYLVQLGGQFSQIIRVETCMNENRPCPWVDRPGYETRCVQKYIRRKLVYFTYESQPDVDDFTIPSCCVCKYTETYYPLFKSGIMHSSFSPKRDIEK